MMINQKQHVMRSNIKHILTCFLALCALAACDPREDRDDLPDEVRDWEPPHTLTDHSTDGLGLIGRAVAEGPRWLRPNGWLLMEVSPDRVKELKRVYSAGGFRDVQSTKGGELKVTRVIVGRRPR